MSESELSDKAFDILENWYENAIKNGQGFKNEKEKQDYIKSIGDPCKHPLFATTTEDLEGHPLTEAFRCLREEDKTLVELSLMYKEEGNAWLKKNTKKDSLEAIKRYAHALTFLDKADQARLDGTECDQDSTVDLKQLRSQIVCNRSLIHLNLNNFGSCCKDSTLAINLWPMNIKAHYRKAKALYKLKKYHECIEACMNGIEYDSINKELLQLKQQSEQEINILDDRKNEINKRIVSELVSKWTITWDIAVDQRISLGYPFYSITEPRELRDCWIHKDSNDEGDGLFTIRSPVLLHYPQYGTYDVLAAAGFDDMLVEHLSVVFPEKGDYDRHVSWDIEEEYQVSNLSVYIQLQTSKLITTKEEWLNACMEHYILSQSGNIDLLRYNVNNIHNQNLERLTFETLKHKVDMREKIFLDYLVKLKSENENNATIEFVEIHLGCTFAKIMKSFHPLYILPRGLLKLIVYPTSSKIHSLFKQQNKNKIAFLSPS